MKTKIAFTFVLAALMLLAGCGKNSNDEELADHQNIVKQGTVQITPLVNSTVLGKEMHFSIYLPPSYFETATAKFPVLFLLHGMGGNYQDWVNNGMAGIVNGQIYKKTTKEMIIVMPDGQDAFYCNNYNGGDIRYEDFFVNEFIPYIEANYRTLPGKTNRAIAGLSMGGYGTAFHAFKYADQYCAAYAMSGAFAMESSAPDLQAIINSKSGDELKSLPAFAFECGTEDFLVFQANESFDAFLTAKNVAHSYLKRSGSHDWTFWKACLPKALDFVSQYFNS